jgi:eukaryotic-like serine/threonine-protein kinase
VADLEGRLVTALADRYRIERELGQGGMATVYLAEDLKHHRKVAVKVLRPELAAGIGPERFAKEIEVAARLLHPHILGLLDSGQADGFFYYVMPFVEGETLRDRLTRAGELPVPEAVRLLSEIAEALAVAHRAGVVHRDIKPENVLLSGRHALVMDFGVAKAVTEASGRQQLTTAGVALGTPAYMAPEQASADPLMDGRVDIYALGVLGYEMLTGHTPFHGLNPQQTLAAHVTQTPVPVGQQRAGLSQALEAVVMRCLAKRPADRYQSADELALQLEPLATPSGGMTPTHTQPHQSFAGAAVAKRPAWLVWAGAATVVALIAIVAFAASRGRARGPAAVVEQRQLTFTGDAYSAAISPDGKWLAYIASDTALLVQEVAGGRAVPVLRGNSFRDPVWSPDGGSLLIGAAVEGDLARDAVWEIPRLGGEPKRLGSNGYSYDYSPDGKSIAWVVFDTLGITDRKTGSERRRLAVPGVSAMRWVRWSPDGRWLAVRASTAKLGAGFFLMDSAGPTLHPISRELGSMAWNEDGTALYILGPSRIVRQRIDRRSATPRDSGETVLSGLSDASSMSLSRDGSTLVVSRGPMSSRNVAVTVTHSGNLAAVEALPLSTGTGSVGAPAMSPDGRWVAWTDRTGTSMSVLLAPFAGGTPRVIARYEGRPVSALRWAPDSRRFGYFVGDSSPYILYTATTDGVAPVRVASLPAGIVSTGGVTLTWAAQGIIVPDSGLRGYQLIDPSSGSARALAPFDSLTRLYSSVISPDGKTLIAARWRPFGFSNDLWQLRLGVGTWTPVPYTVDGDPTPLRWDKSGIYFAIRFFNRPVLAPYEIWRAASPGGPFMPVLTGLRWCTGSPPSLSDDGRHLACQENTSTSDVWLATGFDAGPP